MQADEPTCAAQADLVRCAMRRRNLRTGLLLFAVVLIFSLSVFYKYGAFSTTPAVSMPAEKGQS